MLETGEIIDRYTIQRVLGQGGMAIVYLVEHHQLRSQHALKVLTVGSKAITERMMQEGRVQASLRHPNIVAVHDVIDIAGQPGLLMEYVDGPSLDEFLMKTPLPDPRLALDLFIGTLGAVAHAHESGLIHRDLKPGNILLQKSAGEWIPKVTDFGLAKMMEGDSNLSKTRSGVAMGTPSYMSPEQIRDAKTVDERGDVFALGCILYELFTGRQCFTGDDVLEIFNKICGANYVPPRDLVPDLAPEVETAIVGALRTDKTQRIPDCITLRSILRRDASASAWSRKRSSQETFVGEVPANPTILPSTAAALDSGETLAPADVFSNSSLAGPEAAGGQPTVMRPGGNPTVIRPGAGVDTIGEPRSAQQTLVDPNDAAALLGGPLTALGISNTSLEQYPPASSNSSPLLLAVGVGLLVLLAVGVGGVLTVAVMRPDPVVLVPPAPVERPVPVEEPTPVAKPTPAAKPTPIAKPTPVAKPAPAEEPAPIQKPVQPVAPPPEPVEKPSSALPAGALALRWMGASGSSPLVLEISSQRAHSFTGTLSLRGMPFGVAGHIDGSKVTMNETAGTRVFTGQVRDDGRWQGTWMRSPEAQGGQWLLQPL